MPKEDEGLDMCDVELTDKIMAFKNVWELLIDRDNIWSKWVKHYLLKNQSFWQVRQCESDSWYWRNLLECRGEFQNHLKKIIGNGKSTSLWFDWWL